MEREGKSERDRARASEGWRESERDRERERERERAIVLQEEWGYVENLLFQKTSVELQFCNPFYVLPLTKTHGTMI